MNLVIHGSVPAFPEPGPRDVISMRHGKVEHERSSKCLLWKRIRQPLRESV